MYLLIFFLVFPSVTHHNRTAAVCNKWNDGEGVGTKAKLKFTLAPASSVTTANSQGQIHHDMLLNKCQHSNTVYTHISINESVNFKLIVILKPNS